MYELFVKTHSDMVYVNDTTTLTETLVKLSDLLTDSKKTETELWEEYNKLTNGAPDRFNTFKEVWDYVNVNGDPKSELIQLIEKKQNAEEGKGLSTHDFTDLLYDKLKILNIIPYPSFLRKSHLPQILNKQTENSTCHKSCYTCHI